MKGWIVGLLVALMPVCAILEWIRFRAPDEALCQTCVSKCRTSTGFTIFCVPPERWHHCPSCGQEWWGRKDVACMHGEELDACVR